LDTGWGAKEAVVFDAKVGVKRNTTVGSSVSFKLVQNDQNAVTKMPSTSAFSLLFLAPLRLVCCTKAKA